MFKCLTLRYAVVLLIAPIFAGCYNVADNSKQAVVKKENETVVSQHHATVNSGKITQIIDSSLYSFVKMEGSDEIYMVQIDRDSLRVGDDLIYLPNDKVMLVSQSIDMTTKNITNTITSPLYDDKKIIKKIETLFAKQDRKIQKKLDKITTKLASTRYKEVATKSADESISDELLAKKYYTIKELQENKKALNNKRVDVKAKVTRIFSSFSNSSWMHLKDESDRSLGGSKVVAIVSSPEVDVGDVVTLSGVVHADQKLGFGLDFEVVLRRVRILPNLEH